MTKTEWLRYNWVKIVAILFIIAVGVWIVSDIKEQNRIDKLPQKTMDKFVGTIIQVSGCSRRKYGLDCWVRFDKGQLIYTDVTDWPGSNVQIGQRVYLRVIQYGDERQNLYYVVEGQKYMRHHSNCYSKENDCWRNW